MTDNTITVATVSASGMKIDRVHRMIDLLHHAAIERAVPGDKIVVDVQLWVRIEREDPPAPDTEEAPMMTPWTIDDNGRRRELPAIKPANLADPSHGGRDVRCVKCGRGWRATGGRICPYCGYCSPTPAARARWLGGGK